MEFVDKALARRLEAGEEMPQVYYAQLYREQHPDAQAGAEEIAGGHMTFSELGAPIGRAVGLGLDGPVSAEQLDRLEQFYRSRHAPAQVDVCPLTDPGLVEMLKARQYTMAELNNVLYRQVRREEAIPAASPSITIRPGRPEQADVFGDIVAHSFFREDEIPPRFREWLTPLFQFPGAVRNADLRGTKYDFRLTERGGSIVNRRSAIVNSFTGSNAMNVDAVRRCCLSFPQAKENLQWGDDLCFKAGGKIFAVLDLHSVPQRLSFKCTPEKFAELVEQEEIVPAPYVGRYKWVLLERLDALPYADLKELIRQSYEMVVAKAKRAHRRDRMAHRENKSRI